MQHDIDLPKLKASDKDFFKLELNFTKSNLEGTDWYELRSAIEENTVVREVHVRITKEFVERFPIAELNKIFIAIGQLPRLKYVCLGQMLGHVEVFGHIPVQPITALCQAGGDKVLWLLMRGLVLSHEYRGSDEQKEDKGLLDSSAHDDSEQRSERKKVKGSKKSKEKEKKKKKSSGKKERSTSIKEAFDKFDKKQHAAKRAMDKLGDSLVGLKNLKKISFMGHMDECMHACPLDPLLEGIGNLKELEVVHFALTRHETKVLVDPSSLCGFLDASPKIKEFTIHYTELTDDHFDEVASALANNKSLQELTLSGTGETTPESIGALFRAPHLKKLILQDITLEEPSVMTMCIALAHHHNLTHVEVQCALNGTQLLALQQMLLVNAGIQTLHLYLTDLESISAPLDLVTLSVGNPKGKFTTLKLEVSDANEALASKVRQINIVEWQEVISGVFQVTTSNTANSYILTLAKIEG